MSAAIPALTSAGMTGAATATLIGASKSPANAINTRNRPSTNRFIALSLP
jgi:hypothetical protein